MQQGWIKVHRKILFDTVFQNDKLFKIFMYCLLKATHQEHKQLVGKQFVELKPGQFVFGRRKAAQELNMKESTVRDYIRLLESDNLITVDSTNKYSVITVVNWGIYQQSDNGNRQQNDSRMTTERQQNDTNKNIKNSKNIKKDTSRSKLKFETHHLQLAELLYKEIKRNNPNARKPNVESWANTFRLMMERDNRTGKEIQDMILFSQRHNFWHKNIWSANKWRERFDRLTIEMGSNKRMEREEKKEQIKHVDSDAFMEYMRGG